MNETTKELLHYGRLWLVQKVMGEPLMPYENVYEWLNEERDIRIKNLPDDLSWHDFMTDCILELQQTLDSHRQGKDVFEAMGLEPIAFPEVHHV